MVDAEKGPAPCQKRKGECAVRTRNGWRDEGQREGKGGKEKEKEKETRT